MYFLVVFLFENYASNFASAICSRTQVTSCLLPLSKANEVYCSVSFFCVFGRKRYQSIVMGAMIVIIPYRK